MSDLFIEEPFGLDLEPDQYDELILRLVPDKWSAFERVLFTGKWFDYRFMHPVKATYVYAAEFCKAYRSAFAKNKETKAAPYVKPLPKQDIFECKKQFLVGIWRGRQVADAMGMPYDIFLSRAFKWRMNYWQQQHLPRPWQLYGDLVTDNTAIEWRDLQKGRLMFSTLDEYRNENYCGSPIQDDHHEWLFEQARLRQNRPEIFARFIYDDRVLPEDKVRARIDPTVFEHVLSYRA